MSEGWENFLGVIGGSSKTEGGTTTTTMETVKESKAPLIIGIMVIVLIGAVIIFRIKNKK